MNRIASLCVCGVILCPALVFSQVSSQLRATSAEGMDVCFSVGTLDLIPRANNTAPRKSRYSGLYWAP